MSKIYMAPMEGVTDSIYRRTFAKFYGGVDKYFTPFLSPNDTKKFTTREWKEINPETNDIASTIPQLLTNKSEHFLWACKEISPLGYKEINFNLGCPSGTVVAKKKGSGLLFYPEELDRMLYEIFDGIAGDNSLSNLNISIKTRLGKSSPDEFYEILDIYNKYPICELTIHPRIQTDFYREPLKKEFFDYAYKNAKMPLIFNGDLVSVSDCIACLQEFPEINGIMLGRGLITNPELATVLQTHLTEQSGKTDSIECAENNVKSSDLDLIKFKEFHDSLLEQYIEIMSGDKPVLHRMKEFWAYWSKLFPDSEKDIKKIRKANRLSDYNTGFMLNR